MTETNIKKPTPLKAIRAKCVDCCCGSQYEVKLCPAEDCPLWPYRFGKNPIRKELTPAQKKHLESLKQYRFAKNTAENLRE